MSREAAERKLIDDLLGSFGGGTRPIIARLIESGWFTREDMREAKKLISVPSDTSATSGVVSMKETKEAPGYATEPENTSAGKCGHPACNCTVKDGHKYCSQYCHDARNTLELSCNCGHPGCAEELTHRA